MAKPHEKGRNFGNWLIDRILRLLIWLAMRLPYAIRVRFIGWLMRAVIAPVAGYQRRALDNLALIWPDRPAPERLRIARASADNSGRMLIELYSFAELRERHRGVEAHGPGMEALRHARATGQPVILISGHIGNITAARVPLVHSGFDIGGLYRPMQNPWFNAHYRAAMENMDGPAFAHGRGGTSGFVRHLKQGGMLILLVDQNNWTGADLTFFGRNARTSLAAAKLALRYDALLVPLYGIRQPDGLTFEVSVEAPIPVSDPETMTQAINDSLEAQVRARPEQWFWMHRRWKAPARNSQP